MNFKELFKKHHKRLVLEGVLSSALLGLMTGFFVTGTLASLAWCFGFGNIALALGVGVGIAIATSTAAYFLRYRPTEKDVARRIDSLGLEERAITMLELREDDSLLAIKQREDTFYSVKATESKKMKLLLSTLMIMLTSVALVFAAFATTVLGLSEAGVIPNAEELFGGEVGDWIEISYYADEGGEILGDDNQLLPPGADTTPVVAVADDGWMFLCWDDGSTAPERYETGVDKNMIYTAIFIEIDGEDGDDGSFTEDGDLAVGLPDEIPSMEMLPSDEMTSPPQSSPDSNDPSGTPDPNGAGGKWNDANQFIDGNQYYRDQLDMYYELALEIFKDGGEIPPELREFFENYFDSI
jgi:hypothetical protein